MQRVSPLVSALVAIFALLTVATSIFFLPAAELLPAQVQLGSMEPGLSPVRSLGLMNFYGDIAKNISDTVYHTSNLQDVVKSPARENLPGEDKSYIWYSVFFAMALVFAAIAISAIGRLDSEEKTVIPVKK